MLFEYLQIDFCELTSFLWSYDEKMRFIRSQQLTVLQVQRYDYRNPNYGVSYEIRTSCDCRTLVDFQSVIVI